MNTPDINTLVSSRLSDLATQCQTLLAQGNSEGAFALHLDALDLCAASDGNEAFLFMPDNTFYLGVE
jgi:hypothetical protein